MNLVTGLISFAVFLQNLEMLWLQKYFKACDPWQKNKHGLNQQIYTLVLIFSLVASICVLISPSVAGLSIMLLSTCWISARFGGSFNGGSDFMTFHILAAALLALLFPSYERIALSYVAAQSVMSYFIAGIVKIKSSEWRNGRALPFFLLYANAAHESSTKYWLAKSPILSLIVSWCVIVFELLFPLSLLSPTSAIIFVSLGAVFHLGNVYFFGLNRFFFAWLSSYPAIILLANPLVTGTQ